MIFHSQQQPNNMTKIQGMRTKITLSECNDIVRPQATTNTKSPK